jgi:ParB-like chromosome segregation protein Spo0J
MDVGIDKNEARRGNSASLAAIIRGGKESAPLHGACNKLEVVAVSQLAPYKANARSHTRKQIQKIADSITQFGFCNPILIDDDHGIIAGHGRVEAAKLLGLTEVPALRLSHLSAAEKRAYIIADNRLAELAGWDRDVLAIELQGLRDLNFNVELTGFDIGEVDIILDDADEDSGPNADPGEPISHPVVSQVGDQWLLGEHRLLCGDAKEGQAYAAVDAVIRSWQRLTRKSATLADIGKTFAAIERERASAASPAAARIPSAAAKREAA